MTARQILATAAEWTLRTAAVREARAGIVSLDERRAHALRQARLLLEVASQVRFPVGRLPKGSRPAALVVMYRDAIYWALAARRPGGAPPPPDLDALWAEQDTVELERIAGGPAALAAARRVLLETPTSRALDTSTEDAARAGELAVALVGDLDAARKRTSKLRAQRWMRILLVLVALGVLAAGVARLIRGGDLAASAKLRVSSSLSNCATDPGCYTMLFHTENENNPWVELDLGAPKKIRTIEVINRTDCCSERAVPLVVEGSNDRKLWTPIARRDTEFTTWTATFAPRVVRYVKLSVPRTTPFHLRDIVIR